MAAPIKCCCRLSLLNFSNYLVHKSQPIIFNRLQLGRQQCPIASGSIRPMIQASSFHTSVVDRDLKEFFEDEKNWGASVVKAGRSWRVEELRIKSNEDLHKLWYVLLKEKNMLLTMEHAHKQEAEAFPNPERIDKVEDSMTNLETVVRERNEAYHELEVGNYSEVPKPDRSTPFRHLFCREAKEYAIPQHANEEWQRERVEFTAREASVFVKLMSRKLHNERMRSIRRQRNLVIKLLKKFPNVDEEAIKAQYPNADLVEIKRRFMS